MLGEALGKTLDELAAIQGEELRGQRRARYRRAGIYSARSQEPALQPGPEVYPQGTLRYPQYPQCFPLPP